MDKKDKAFEIVKGLVQILREGKEVRLTRDTMQIISMGAVTYESERAGGSWSDMVHETVSDWQTVKEPTYIGEV